MYLYLYTYICAYIQRRVTDAAGAASSPLRCIQLTQSACRNPKSIMKQKQNETKKKLNLIHTYTVHTHTHRKLRQCFELYFPCGFSYIHALVCVWYTHKNCCISFTEKVHLIIKLYQKKIFKFLLVNSTEVNRKKKYTESKGPSMTKIFFLFMKITLSLWDIQNILVIHCKFLFQFN